MTNQEGSAERFVCAGLKRARVGIVDGRAVMVRDEVKARGGRLVLDRDWLGKGWSVSQTLRAGAWHDDDGRLAEGPHAHPEDNASRQGHAFEVVAELLIDTEEPSAEEVRARSRAAFAAAVAEERASYPAWKAAADAKRASR